MSRSRKRLDIALLAAILLRYLGALILEAQTHIVRRLISDRLYDSRNHYLPCAAWPAAADVCRIIEEHRDLVTAIEKVHPQHVGIELDATTRPGKADLLIWYASHQDRLAIESLIGGDSFFGVPMRLQNR